MCYTTVQEALFVNKRKKGNQEPSIHFIPSHRHCHKLTTTTAQEENSKGTQKSKGRGERRRRDDQALGEFPPYTSNPTLPPTNAHPPPSPTHTLPVKPPRPICLPPLLRTPLSPTPMGCQGLVVIASHLAYKTDCQCYPGNGITSVC